MVKHVQYTPDEELVVSIDELDDYGIDLRDNEGITPEDLVEPNEGGDEDEHNEG